MQKAAAKNIIRNPWEWRLRIVLTFKNGTYDGNIPCSPFFCREETASYRAVFLGALEKRCQALGIELEIIRDEIEMMGRDEEYPFGDSNPALEAIFSLADLLRSWMWLANTELCHLEPAEDGRIIKKF